MAHEYVRACAQDEKWEAQPAPSNEHEKLKQLCKELLAAANALSLSEYAIVQPFFSIIKNHYELINKLNLME